MLHETPSRFGRKHSQTIMGYQMAAAYTGTTFMPPVIGFIVSHTTMGVFTICIVIFIAVMILCSEKLNSLLKTSQLLKQER